MIPITRKNEGHLNGATHPIVRPTISTHIRVSYSLLRSLTQKQKITGFNELFTAVGSLAVVQIRVGKVNKARFGYDGNGHIGKMKITMHNAFFVDTAEILKQSASVGTDKGQIYRPPGW